MDMCQMIRIIRKDEADAPNMYEKLRASLNKNDRAEIDKIIRDEKRHYEVMSRLSHLKCGT